MQHHIHQEPSIRIAYSHIAGFFDGTTLAEALQQAEQLVHYACRNKMHTGKGGNLFFFVQRLQELCDAVFIIHYERGQRRQAVLPVPPNRQPDITQKKHYVNPQYKGGPWSCMPRHLGSKQYHDPYRAFAKFVHTMSETEWRKALQLLLEFALCKGCMEGFYDMHTILLAQKRLLQVIEACHLVYVRTEV